MAVKIQSIMPKHTPALEALEKEWNDAEKILVRGTVTPDVAEFLEQEAFNDFGMMKKGAIGLELTKLLRIAKDCLEKQESTIE